MNRNYYKTILLRTFLLVNVLVFTCSASVSALTAKQKSYIDGHSLWIDEEVDSCATDASSDQLNLTSLPIREKLAQMLMPRIDNEADLNTVTSSKVGGFFVGRDHIMALSPKILEKQGQAAGNPYLVSIDGEGGTVDVPIGTNPPSALEMGGMTDARVKQIAKDFGAELAGLGVNMDLAPDADVVDNINAGVIKTRSFGNNNAKVVAKARAFAEGLNESGVLPTFKHFPGHGHATKAVGGGGLADSHLDDDAFVQNKAALTAGDLAPFVELATTLPSAIMVGHLIIPDVNPSVPATISPEVIEGILRQEIGYTGLIITDDMGDMHPIERRFPGNFPEAAFKAIKAGNDIVLFVNRNGEIEEVLDRLVAAVDAGQLTEARIDESMGRIATAKSAAQPAAQQAPGAGAGCACNAPGAGGGGTLTTAIPDVWRNLINATAPTYPEADPRLVAATLWIEQRGWPEYKTSGWAVSSASAQGPWQFIPSTWASMATDGNGDGVMDPNDPADEVHAAFKHQLGSTGKPIAVRGYGGSNAEQDFQTTVFERNDTNLLYYIAKYNGSGAPDGVLLKNFPRGQNADYVRMGYWLLATNFERGWLPGDPGEFVDAKVTGTLFGGGDSPPPGSSTCPPANAGGQIVGEFGWPVDKHFYDEHSDWFTKPHHDYPAADIPVPLGTKVYSMTSGTIISAPVGGDCGTGVLVEAASGVRFIYCHGSNGGSVAGAAQGDTVQAGQYIMDSASTGHSSGPHLHVGIKVNEVAHCPQALFTAMASGNPPTLTELGTLPTSGCTN